MNNPKLLGDGGRAITESDITLLDLAALFVMQGLIASWRITGKGDFPEDNPRKIAEDSYGLARAMLEERENILKGLEGESNA